MKLYILLLSFIPLVSIAQDTKVISGQTKHIQHSDGSKESLVTELNLNNCNININAAETEGGDHISITFSNREFIATEISIKTNKDGTCTLDLVKGKGVK